MVRVMFQGSRECSADEVLKIEEIKTSENINRNSELISFSMDFLIRNYDYLKGRKHVGKGGNKNQED